YTEGAAGQARRGGEGSLTAWEGGRVRFRANHSGRVGNCDSSSHSLARFHHARAIFVSRGTPAGQHGRLGCGTYPEGEHGPPLAGGEAGGGALRVRLSENGRGEGRRGRARQRRGSLLGGADGTPGARL